MAEKITCKFSFCVYSDDDLSLWEAYFSLIIFKFLNIKVRNKGSFLASLPPRTDSLISFQTEEYLMDNIDMMWKKMPILTNEICACCDGTTIKIKRKKVSLVVYGLEEANQRFGVEVPLIALDAIVQFGASFEVDVIS